MGLFTELKRRKVIRVGVGYLAGGWLLIQIAETILPLFGLDAAVRLLVVVLAIGFLPALAFAWAFQLTPDGLRREEDVDRSTAASQKRGQVLDRLVMVVLALAIGYFAFDKFVLDPARDAKREAVVAEQARSEALIESYGDNSIAVMPFVNMSSDPAQEFLSDGIAEELLNLLAGIPELRVISRSSSFSFKGEDIDMPTLAEQLNVAHVLEGSVRKAGNRLRISAQLIEARSDTHLWSKTYDRTIDDVFTMQDEIAASVVESLKLTLLRNDAPRVRKVAPEAYTLFLRSRHIRRQGTPEAYETALQLNQEALAIDPGYPPAWEGVAEMYVLQATRGLRPVDEGFRLARQAINRALLIDPEFGVGVAGLGWIAILYDHDIAAAARHFERALTLAPTDLDVISGVAFMADATGRPDAAIAFNEYAVSRDPMGPVAHFDLATVYLNAGRPDDAAASARIGLALRPGHGYAHYSLGMALLLKGDLHAARDEMEQETLEVYRLTGLAVVHHDLGHRDESEKFLRELIGKYTEEASFQIAGVFAWRGDQDHAFEWLERARDYNDPGLSGIVSHYAFRNLHDDARWQLLLARLGTSDAQLKAIEFDVRLPE